MEYYVLDSFQALNAVPSENLERHHNCILHNLSVVFEMEYVDSSVVRTGRHQWILFVEVYVSYGFLMELHCFVRFCRQVYIIANQLKISNKLLPFGSQSLSLCNCLEDGCPYKNKDLTLLKAS